jgi:sigma-B regulation protein RsbU (phosphoserine phosphatase)
MGALVPLTILLITLLTLQWEVDSSVMTAEKYGRGILGFTFILFFYALFASGTLNRVVNRSITQPISEMVRVLNRIRGGDFDTKVRVVSNDEIGHIGDVINEMTEGLKEREQVRQSLQLAREIQQNLLPKDNPDIDGLDIAGTSIYCDETGGDYYDFIVPEKGIPGQVRIVLGDVSGHGISAALLMATARALIRQRSLMPGSIGEVVSDVNRQLSRDVLETGSFMTLFYLDVDARNNRLAWVRAGHDPALIYNPETD